MRKFLYLFFTTLFIAACLLPGVGMLAFGPSPAAGNETAKALPRLTKEDGSLNVELLSDAAAWFS